MESERWEIADAVILMAGSGSRLRATGDSLPKPLVPIRGRPLISYTLAALAEIGVTTLHAIVGCDREVLLEGLKPLIPASMHLHAINNPQWQKQNGISLLCAAPFLATSFLLLMGDHLFERAALHEFVRRAQREDLNLAIDRKIESIYDLDDAMKVQTHDDRVVAIGKNLETYDAIDTGLFLCPPEIFRYLEAAKQNGDCSLADGVRLMAGQNKVYAVDIGNAWWQDVDNAAMLRQAEEAATRLTSRK